jgi:uncharacterized protein
MPNSALVVTPPPSHAFERRMATGVFLRVATAVFSALVTARSADAVVAGLAGHWRGVLMREGVETAFLLDFYRDKDEWRGSFGLPEQRVLEYPLDKVKYISPHLSAAGPGDDFTLEGTLSGDSLSGVFRDGRGPATFRLTRTAEEPPYTSENVRFANSGVTLAGSLYIPKGPGPYPAVVFLHGSGPEIRWGASRFLSDYFARRGIATLIYDKRGTGQSTGDWRLADFSALAGDALAAMRFLKTRHLIDPQKIGIYGHSQGGTIAPLVASLTPEVAFVISAAGSAIPMWQSEIFSLRTQVRETGIQGESLQRADSFIDRILAVARSGKGVQELKTEWEAARVRGDRWVEVLQLPDQDNYWWSFFPKIAEYNAAENWEKVNVPVLVVQAGKDIYTPSELSVAAIDAALRKAHNPDFTILVLPGAPHNLVIQPDVKSGLKWPRLYPGYADLLVGWIRYRTRIARP